MTDSASHRVLLTGASGRVGAVLRRGLAAEGLDLVATDRRTPQPVTTRETVESLDMGDFGRLVQACQRVDSIVHLAAIAMEAPFEDILEANLRGTYHVFEAARRAHVPRVVLASSAHTIGFYERGEIVEPTSPPRPDSLYGASKVFGEALGRLYADKFGVRCACVRIGSLGPRPKDQRQRSTWLSHRDAVHLFHRCLVTDGWDFLVLFGVSANQASWWHNPDASRIGYQPVDDAEQYVSELAPEEAGDGQGSRCQGGSFVDLLPGHGKTVEGEKS